MKEEKGPFYDEQIQCIWGVKEGITWNIPLEVIGRDAMYDYPDKRIE